MLERVAPVVLVVDDNVANRAVAQAALKDEGFAVVMAVDGKAGVAAFAASSPDCVLLDVRMPGIDGFSACRQIRALPGGAEVPVIFLTALRDVDTFDQALLAGGDDFLTKPVRPTELIVRVQTALKLRKVQAELREHYDLLKRQRDDLQRVQLQKERLMAFVVHDLKNPVNTLDLHAQLLQRNPGLPPSARDSVQQIRDEARQLNRLLLNLLDVSKADEGKLIPQKCAAALAPLVDSVVHELGALARARKVRLPVSLLASTATADSELLRRLLVNLVENAIRHAPGGSSVTISSQSKAGATELWVRDEGKGVSPELRERIFEPFVQLDAGLGAVNGGGRGLGLTFCRLVAEAHGGAIWVEDAAPGALFRVRLPGP
jgi:two-component system sensor histidine kinase/response regulator